MTLKKYLKTIRVVILLFVPLSIGACASARVPERAEPLSAQGSSDARQPSAISSQAVITIEKDVVIVPAQAERGKEVDDRTINPVANNELGVLSRRVLRERETAFNPYVLTAHKHNFVLPVSYSTGINEDIYRENNVPLREGLQPAEVKFQISLKTRLNEEDLFYANDSLSLGITLEAWWQLYSSDLSSPFRETNYQPEVFYLVPLLWGPFGTNTALLTGFEHQSNGQVPGLSRSWNRLYAALIVERGNFIGSIRPWYRIPEKSKKNPGDAEGDDNPDILDFMGHGELSLGWRTSTYELDLTTRGNTSTGKGAVKVGLTFPMFAKFKGFVQFFSGYGDSLIDYDHYQQRLGIGVALTNMY